MEEHASYSEFLAEVSGCYGEKEIRDALDFMDYNYGATGYLGERLLQDHAVKTAILVCQNVKQRGLIKGMDGSSMIKAALLHHLDEFHVDLGIMTRFGFKTESINEKIRSEDLDYIAEDTCALIVYRFNIIDKFNNIDLMDNEARKKFVAQMNEMMPKWKELDLCGHEMIKKVQPILVG